MTKTKTVKKNYDNGTEVSKLVKLVIIVTVIFVIFYGITVLVNKKEENPGNNSNGQTVSIQYDEILIGNILTQPNDEYYVMIYDSDDTNSVVYNSYLQLYQQKRDALRYYKQPRLNNDF